MRQQDIEAIQAMDNLILRNLKITQSYYRLAEELRDFGWDSNASWLSFGAYASKTAGYSIRHELLPEDLERVFRSFYLYRRMMGFLRRFLISVDERDRELDPISEILTGISLRISEGNLLVFAELAPAFNELAAEFTGDSEFDEEKLARYLARFKPGPVEVGGQDHIVEAFRAYYETKFAADADRKAELVFLANMLVGLHEQTRLQPKIAEAMYMPVDEVLGEQVQMITPLGNRISGWLHRALLGISRRIFAGIATQLFMSIYLPTGELRLGRDVEPSVRDEYFPTELREIESERVRQLLKRYDRSGDTLHRSRADDWSDLDDRMNYIVDLFRSYQQERALFDPPFTPDQMAEIDDGRIPEGEL
jgi:hypothetical protein